MTEGNGDSPGSGSQTGTGAYKEAVEGGNGTFGLIKDIDTYFGAPFQRYFRSKETARRLKIELGQWHDFLYEKNRGVYYTPILSSSSFTEYLKTCKGVFRPEGECKATAAWAQFVHGLGITPGKNVLSKRPHRAEDDINITLEVDGEVICHIINLLAYPSSLGDTYVWNLLKGGSRTFKTKLGDLVYKRNQETEAISLQYRPYSLKEISSAHRTFDAVSKPSALHRDMDDLWAKYELALDSGLTTSDTSLVWPDPSRTHISKRLRKLLDSIAKISAENLSPQDVPIFITESWCRGAERIRHRAVGGENMEEVFEDACARLAADFPKDKDFEKIVRAIRMFLQRRFVISYRKDDSKSPPQLSRSERTALGVIQDTLKSYEDQDPGTWKHDLYMCRRTLVELWEDFSFEVEYRNVCIIPFDRSTDLWKTMLLRLDGV